MIQKTHLHQLACLSLTLFISFAFVSPKVFAQNDHDRYIARCINKCHSSNAALQKCTGTVKNKGHKYTVKENCELKYNIMIKRYKPKFHDILM